MASILVEAAGGKSPEASRAREKRGESLKSHQRDVPDGVKMQTKDTVDRGEPPWRERLGIISLVPTYP